MKIDLAKSKLNNLTFRELEILYFIAEGYSDKKIAEDLFLSINTIRWHNRNIYDKLGVKSRTQALVTAAKKGLLKEQPTIGPIAVEPKKHNLPAQTSSFIGRENEIREIKHLLDIARLLTLTGSAGVGKTRLALAAAYELVDERKFNHGVFLVELAPVRKETGVISAILDSLGITTSPRDSNLETLKSYLKNKEILLVIDNFEHLLRSAYLVLKLLSSAPHIKVLSTSRERLNLSGEQVFPVPCLKVPELSGNPEIGALINCDSVELFLKRANDIKPDLLRSGKDINTVAEICVHLDGLPLAIELAAARMKDLNIKNILHQIGNRFEVLVDSSKVKTKRHQTLEKAIDWSYQLLNEEEKILLNRLAVFRGRFTFEAADQVCCRDLSLNELDGLSSLLSKNLIQLVEEQGTEPRFTMLETINEYAQKRLEDSGEAEKIKERHSKYFTAYAERNRFAIRGGPHQILILKRMISCFDNIRSVYKWTIEEGNDPVLGVRLVGLLDYFWGEAGFHNEGKEWINKSLSIIDNVPPTLHANLYSAAGNIYFIFQAFDLSRDYFDRALALYSDAGNKQELGWTHINAMKSLEGNEDNYRHLLDHLFQGLTILTELDDKPGIAQAWITMGVHASLVGNQFLYKKAIEKALTITREIEDVNLELRCMVHLGNVALKENQAKTAQSIFLELLQRELSIFKSLAEVEGTMELLAGAAISLGKPRRAIVLLSASEHLRKTRWGDDKIHFMHESLVKEYRKSSSEQVNEETFSLAWNEGQVMSLEEAIAFALEVE